MISALSWHEANQRYLSAALAVLRSALERHCKKDAGEGSALGERLDEAARSMTGPPALEMICTIFGLSGFERQMLLLCAGAELDSKFSQLCAEAQGSMPYPTFSLALAVLSDPHWSALTPAAPLRYWKLIEIGAGSTLTLSPLKIDERILHYLTGIQYLDERLAGILEPFEVERELVPSHEAVARRLASAWSRKREATLQLYGGETASRRAIAQEACRSAGLKLWLMPASAVPLIPNEMSTLIRLWSRESVLSSSALMLECDVVESVDALRWNAIRQFIDLAGGFLIVSSRERQSAGGPMVAFEVGKPTSREQMTIWQSGLGSLADYLNGHVEAVVSQFNLDAQDIHQACAQVTESESGDLGRALWDACRVQSRPYREDLAQRIEAVASWDDLVLPGAQIQTLREIAAQVRHRTKVYDTWGFASKGSRGMGISALFSGSSGTGKTMAAEVLARELSLDLYRIDLSQVVSKYIGETEKNLREVFNAAEEGGAILLFDEADALFGKRTEVKDSHDRYANIEVSYLLQRMESYNGLAILTTNMKDALDAAFLRRIRFIVQFPFPDTGQRAQIWGKIFPKETPVEGLDVKKLSRLNLAGGNIRNIALSAAFLAAGSGEPVGMKHLLHAARAEYAKLERPLTEAEVGGWI